MVSCPRCSKTEPRCISLYESGCAGTTSNTQIGVAKGANPGRVVWVHDSTVSRWAVLGDGHWWQSSHTDQTITDKMMSRSLLELSGKTGSNLQRDIFKQINCHIDETQD